MKNLTIWIAIAVMISCSKETEPTDKEYYKAFSIADPHYNEVLFDEANDLIYAFDTEGGEMLCYSYLENKILTKRKKNFNVERFGYSLGPDGENTNLFLTDGAKIYVYESVTLKALYEIPLPQISSGVSIEVLNREILVIAYCDSEGTISINRKGEVISQAQYGTTCKRLHGYNKAEETIQVISAGYSSTKPPRCRDAYNKDGTIAENFIKFLHPTTINIGAFATTDNIDYFINGNEGQVFNKSDLEPLEKTGGNYEDFAINDKVLPNIIYGLSREFRLHKFEYPTLNLVDSKPLKNFPMNLTIDDDEVIIVYQDGIKTKGKLGIYISQIKI